MAFLLLLLLLYVRDDIWAKRNSSHEIKSKQNCSIDGCPSIELRVVRWMCIGAVLAVCVFIRFLSLFVGSFVFLTVYCVCIGPQILWLLPLKHLFEIWFCNMGKSNMLCTIVTSKSNGTRYDRFYFGYIFLIFHFAKWKKKKRQRIFCNIDLLKKYLSRFYLTKAGKEKKTEKVIFRGWLNHLRFQCVMKMSKRGHCYHQLSTINPLIQRRQTCIFFLLLILLSMSQTLFSFLHSIKSHTQAIKLEKTRKRTSSWIEWGKLIAKSLTSQINEE